MFINKYLTAQQIRSAVPASRDWIVNGIVEVQDKVLPHYGFNEPHRYVLFMAQLAHESAHFKTLKEYHDGSNYEGRGDLGNTKRGDGVRFRGSGLIQRTGRKNTTNSFNYWFGKKEKRILASLVKKRPKNPAEWSLMLRDDSRIALEDGCLYWTRDRKMHRLADNPNFKEALLTVTKAINGGYNGLVNRREYTRSLGLATLGYSFLKVMQEDNGLSPDGQWGSISDQKMWDLLIEADYDFAQQETENPNVADDNEQNEHSAAVTLLTLIAELIAKFFGGKS